MSTPAPTGPRRRVLLVSYHFLPVHNVGVTQFLNYCRYLPESGWDPVVLSRDWSTGLAPEDEGWGLSYVEGEEGRVPIRTAPYRSYRNRVWAWHERLKEGAPATSAWAPRKLRAVARKSLSPFWHFFGPYPDRFRGWVPAAVAEGARLLREERFDAIVSNCPPETNHLVASILARRFGIPWVPYFGDLYGFYVGPGDWHGGRAQRAVARRMHRRWLRPAASAMVVSPRMGRLLREEYGVPAEVVVVGYDEERFLGAEPAPSDRMRLSHVGSIYPGDQRPEIFLDGLDRFLRAQPGARVEVKLVGSKVEPWLRETLAGRPAAGVCAIVPKVSPDEAVRLQRASDVLLLFNLTAEQSRGGTLSYPSKVFEYLAAERPILAVPGDGDWVDSLVKGANAGVVAHTPDEVAAQLHAWYAEWVRAGRLAHAGRREVVHQFGHRQLAARIASLLDRAVGSRGRRVVHDPEAAAVESD